MDYFNLKFHNATIKNEIFAGISLFMAMSYILVVCPSMLSETGMDYNGVFLATVFVSGITTIISAFYTKLPIAYAPGLGLAGMFVSLATGPSQVHWTVLLLATYVAGIFICAFVKFGVYDKIMEVMDVGFRRIIMSGIGLALFLYGISTLGLLEKSNGMYSFGEIKIFPLVVCGISLGIMYMLKKNNIKGYMLAGLVVAYVFSICGDFYFEFQKTGISINEYCQEVFSISYRIKDVKNVMLTYPYIVDILTDKEGFTVFINAVFVFTMGHFFDAVGTNTSTFDAINNNIDMRVKETLNLKRAINADGIGGIVSGLMGTSSVTSYAESLVGVVSGGKTGITAITTGCLFLLSFFFAPLFTSMATYVAAPALIYVGLSLTLRFKEFERGNKILFVFGIILLAYIGITFNTGNAVLYGLIVYTIIKMLIYKEKPVSKWWIVLIFAAVHIWLNYIV